MDIAPTSAELLPCPFCGGTDAFVERLNYSSAYVQCDSDVGDGCVCMARGPIAVQEDDGEDIPGGAGAITAWNRRAAMQTSEPVLKAIREACDIAMRHCIEARVPECGHFAEIAQGLSWALDQLAAPDRAPSTATNSCARCGKPLHADSIHTCTPPDHAPSAALIGAGARMSNIIYNLAQKPGYTLDNVDLSLFDGVRKEWDHWLTEYRRAPSTEHEDADWKCEILAKQVADWRKEVARLHDLIDTATGAPSTDSAADALREAVGKLIKARGRFHTERNYAALVAAYDAMQSKDSP